MVSPYGVRFLFFMFYFAWPDTAAHNLHAILVPAAPFRTYQTHLRLPSAPIARPKMKFLALAALFAVFAFSLTASALTLPPACKSRSPLRMSPVTQPRDSIQSAFKGSPVVIASDYRVAGGFWLATALLAKVCRNLGPTPSPTPGPNPVHTAHEGTSKPLLRPC